MTLAVGKILEDNGIDVVYTRTTDIYQTPFEKAKIANEAGADYFISFHRNSSPEENQYQGVEVLVYDKSGIKYDMAQNIVGAWVNLDSKNWGSMRGRVLSFFVRPGCRHFWWRQDF